MSDRAETSLQYLKGVGPKRARALESLGLKTLRDLLLYFPFRHEPEQGELPIADLVEGTVATIRGSICHVARRHPMLVAEVDDGSQACELRWFNATHVARNLRSGATVIATGKVKRYNGILHLAQPRVEVYPPDADGPPNPVQPRLVGVYRVNPQVTNAGLRAAIDTLLPEAEAILDEPLPIALREARDLPDRVAAVRGMHQPASEAELERARRRIAYEELFLMQLGLAVRRRHLLDREHGYKLRITPEIDRRIRARFPFPLTSFQDDALREIVRDLADGRPMTRLLQGDVGSGKTVVALYACLLAIAGGHQAAIMAPTEVLAQQHYARIEQYLRGSRVRRALLRGRMKPVERNRIIADTEAGRLNLLVGTHALLQSDVAFQSLGLVIVDEQHKFGVQQRVGLRTKGVRPHCLVMTATPIPRSLAMTVLGDLEVSAIRGAPPGRGSVRTRIIWPAKWHEALAALRPRLEAGEQAYFVCPAIGGGDAEEDARKKVRLVTAEESFARLAEGPWAGLRLGLLHGSLKADEKQAVLDRFAANELHAVVATTVVEVGVDVPNATMMVIENADRFGLSQLHQLRGRVGRGRGDSLCLLIARSRSAKVRERLGVLRETTDGFRIAETDLKLRGPGELLGTRQHGLPELQVASMVDDFELLELARDDAFALAAEDPKLMRPEHKRLRAAVRRQLGDRLTLLDSG